MVMKIVRFGKVAVTPANDNSHNPEHGYKLTLEHAKDIRPLYPEDGNTVLCDISVTLRVLSGTEVLLLRSGMSGSWGGSAPGAGRFCWNVSSMGLRGIADNTHIQTSKYVEG